MVKIICRTLFDITASGVIERKYNDKTATAEHQLACKQQRNWNTMQQILMLRTLPENITLPVKDDNVWSFTFEIPNIESVAWGVDPVGALRYDANGVPMLHGLTELCSLPEILLPYGSNINVWFEIVDK